MNEAADRVRRTRRWIMLATLAWIWSVLLRPLAAQDVDSGSRPTSVPGTALPTSQPAGIRRTTLHIEIAGSDPVLEGHGPSKSITYVTTTRGTLSVHALSDTMDLFLRATLESTAGATAIPPSAPTVFENENGGGYPAPFLRITSQAGWKYTITVAPSSTPPTSRPAAPPRTSSSGAATIVLVEIAEDDATIDVAREVGIIRAESKDLAAAGRSAAARRKLEEIAGRLLVLGDAHASVALDRCIFDVGKDAFGLGDLETARRCWEWSTRFRASIDFEDHPEIHRARENLAATIYSLGDLMAARRIFERVLEARARTLPDDHPDIQRTRQNVAVTMKELGDVQGARKLEEKVLEVRSRTLPDDDPDLQLARQNLAVTLKALDEFQAARKLEEKVLEIRSRTLPDDDLSLQKARLNLALTMKVMGEVEAARPLEEKALDVLLRTLPDDHPEVQAVRQSMAVTVEMLGDLEAARRLQAKVLDIRSRTLPNDHPDVQAARRNLAVTLCEMASRHEMTAIIADLLQGIRGHGLLAQTSSPREVVARLAVDARSTNLAISLLARSGTMAGSSIDSDLFWTVEDRRARFLVASRLRHLAAGAEISSQVEAARARVQAAAADIARHTSRGAVAELAQSVRERDAAEREIIGLLGGLPGAARLSTEPTVIALASRLGPNEALVGYVRFDDWRENEEDASRSWKATPSYLAWVLRAGPVLVRVDLGPAAAIDQAIDLFRFEIRSDVTTPQALERLGTRIRRLVLDPLAAALVNAESITVAPSDAVFLVPFDALPDKDGLVGDRVRIHVRSTLQETLRDAPASTAPPSLLGVGGVDYDAAPEHFVRTTEASMPAADDRRGADGRGFENLPGTGLEVQSVAGLFHSRFGDARACRVLEASDASKSRILVGAPKARFLHLATHGFYAPVSVPCVTDTKPLDAKLGVMRGSDSRQDVIGLSPMVLCGLAVAGANRPDDEWGRIEGCITAEEIAALDLSGCELCVLSACDTSIGIRRAGMGMASLQTALHAAGVRTAITSLWKVPDQATRELMTDFYRRMWIEKKPKSQALWEAKVRLRDMKDENGKPRYSLRDWAAWVLTGEPD